MFEGGKECLGLSRQHYQNLTMQLGAKCSDMRRSVKLDLCKVYQRSVCIERSYITPKSGSVFSKMVH